MISTNTTRRQATIRRIGVLGVSIAVAVAACTGSSGSDTESGTGPTTEAAATPDSSPETTDDANTTVDGVDAGQDSNGPPGDPAQTVTRADVDAILERIPVEVEALLDASGVPGMAVAVVFEDEIVLADGYGVREVGKDDPVGPDTVFQIASLSKPISATAVAAVVGDEIVAWDDPVANHLPDLALSDPYTTDNVTIADMFTHRSGLPMHAGDLLEDLGFDRAAVYERLVQEPLRPFRAQHLYTNFGLTAGADAAAAAAGTTWEKLIDERLFTPAGMTDSSALFDDYISATDRAVPHMLDADGTFSARAQRNPDEQSPAGGVSSTATDLGTWMRLQLGAGELDGTTIVEPDALLEMQTPHSLSNAPRTPSAHSGFYGLGMGVSVRDDGYVRWSHSGAFLLGTGTNFVMVPGQQVGVAVITNGAPVGLAESTSETILDLIIDGEVTRDWFAGYSMVFAGLFESELPTDWSEPAEDPAPPSPLATYVGTYDNDYYGPLEVVESGASLVMTLGPDATSFALEPYDSDTFLFTPPGENSLGPTGIVFQVEGEQAVSVTSEFYDTTGLGTWIRG